MVYSAACRLTRPCCRCRVAPALAKGRGNIAVASGARSFKLAALGAKQVAAATTQPNAPPALPPFLATLRDWWQSGGAWRLSQDGAAASGGGDSEEDEREAALAGGGGGSAGPTA